MTETWHEIKKRHQKELIDALMALSHLTMREAADELGTTHQVVASYIRDKGIKWPTPGRCGAAPLSEAQRKLRIEIAKVGAPADFIVEHLGITRNSFLSWCYQNDVEVAA